MNLADVFTVVLVILGLLTVFVGYWLMAAGLFPRRVGQCAERLGTRPYLCGLVGLAGIVPLITAGIVVSRVAQSAPGKAFSVLLIVTAILMALFGAAGLALRIGQGLRSSADEQEPWRRVYRGGVVLAITFGTLVLLPVALVAGFGAFVLALVQRDGQPPPPPASAVP